MKMTIPQLDITHLTENQVVVDREAGIYLGHVTTALMDDGKTIYAVYPKCHALGQIVLKRSDDGGKIWSERLPVPESWTWSMECPTLYKLNDAQGKQRLCRMIPGPRCMNLTQPSGLATTISNCT